MILACAIALLTCRQAEPEVSFELPNISLPQFSERLKAATGKSLNLTPNLKNRSISVFVKDRKPSEVVAAIANTLDASLTTYSDGWTLAEDRDRATSLRIYMLAEDRLLLAKNEEKVAALARLTQGLKPGSTGADDWAKEKIAVGRFYALGMWRRLNPTRSLIEVSGYPHAFRITEPENDVVARSRAAWIDSDSEKLAGTHVCFRVCPHTGELQVVKILGGREEDGHTKFPYAFASPPDELKSTRFATFLAGWVWKGLPAEYPEKATLPNSVPDREEPPFGKYSVGDKLQELHKRFGVDIVSDAFRIPAISQTMTKGDKLGTVLGQVVRDEKLFTKWQGSLLEVRHPAFWRLVATEPTPQSIARLESISEKSSPSLDDYAQFMASNSLDILTRFDHPDRLLVKFSTEPLRLSAPAYRVLGNLSQQARNRVKNGEPYSWAPGYDRVEMNDMALLAPFYETRINSREEIWFEAFPHNGPYLSARGIRLGSSSPYSTHWATVMGFLIDPASASSVFYMGHTPEDAIYWNLGLN